MKVTQKLNVSAQYVYNRIIESVQYDISECTGQSVSPDQLVGFKYEKNLVVGQQVEIEILAIEPEKKYQFVTTSEKSTFNTLYEIEPIDDGSCQVQYTETATSQGGFIQSMNDMLVGFMYSILKKKRVKQLLTEIENSAVTNTEQ